MLRNERGNAIFYSLVSVGLVAAISTTVVHMMNQLSSSAGRMSRRFVADTVERTMLLISSDRHVCGTALRDAANNPILYTGGNINIPRIRVGGTTMLEAGQPINMYNQTSNSDVRLVSITFRETDATMRKVQPLGTAQNSYTNTMYNTFVGNLEFVFEPSRTSFFSGGGFVHTVPFDIATETAGPNVNRITWCSGRKTLAGICQDLGGTLDAAGNCSPTLTSFNCSNVVMPEQGNCIGPRPAFRCRDQLRIKSIGPDFVPVCECFRTCCPRICCNRVVTITSSSSSPMGSPCPAGGSGTVLSDTNVCQPGPNCPAAHAGPTGGCVTGTWVTYSLRNYPSCGDDCGGCKDAFDAGSIN